MPTFMTRRPTIEMATPALTSTISPHHKATALSSEASPEAEEMVSISMILTATEVTASRSTISPITMAMVSHSVILTTLPITSLSTVDYCF